MDRNDPLRAPALDVQAHVPYAGHILEEAAEAARPRSWISREAEKFACAGRGIWRVFLTQPHARLHGAIALTVGALAVWLQLPPVQLALLAAMMGLVLVAEVVNTALERAVDLASPRWHPIARDAKDMAAGAVLVAAITAAAVGYLLLGPPLAARLVHSA
jgi:diacylglycerol kinase